MRRLRLRFKEGDWYVNIWTVGGKHIDFANLPKTVIIGCRTCQVTWTMGTRHYYDHGHQYPYTVIDGTIPDEKYGVPVSLKNILARKFPIYVEV